MSGGMQDYFRNLRQTRKDAAPWNSRGITLDRVREVVRAMNIADPSAAEAILALLDDGLENYYPAARSAGRKFAEGASTAQIGCHVGIFQRGGTKLDREGRDYWIKPLREVGAIEICYCLPETGEIVAGHLKAKSPNCCYRLDPGFVTVLASPDWKDKLGAYLEKSSVGRRLKAQAEAATAAAEKVEHGHADLIRQCRDLYVPRFLPGYDVIYIDDGDGDRITEEQRAALDRAGIRLTLEDSYPDMLLHSASDHALWFIEAVTSDGEVDEQKVQGCLRIAERAKLKLGGLTTTYASWRAAAARQGRMKNLAPGSYVWIVEDAGRQFRVEEPLPPR